MKERRSELWVQEDSTNRHRGQTTTLLQRKLAEDQREAAEASRAKADNAYRNAMTLSPEQFLRLETIKMQRDVCSSGHCTFILSDGKISPIVNTKE
jgi:hypothetical protein